MRISLAWSGVSGTQVILAETALNRSMEESDGTSGTVIIDSKEENINVFLTLNVLSTNINKVGTPAKITQLAYGI